MFGDFSVNCCNVMCWDWDRHGFNFNSLSHELLVEFLGNFDVFLMGGLVDNGLRIGHLNIADWLWGDAISVRLGRHFDVAWLIRGGLDKTRIILGTVGICHDDRLSVAIGRSGTISRKHSVIGIISCAVFLSGCLNCGNGSNDE